MAGEIIGMRVALGVPHLPSVARGAQERSSSDLQAQGHCPHCRSVCVCVCVHACTMLEHVANRAFQLGVVMSKAEESESTRKRPIPEVLSILQQKS